MITINDGNISFVEKHLFEPKIETFEGILERYRDYQVEFFLHVVSDPSCRSCIQCVDAPSNVVLTFNESANDPVMHFC